MTSKEEEQYLDFLRYSEVPRETVSRKDERWLSSKEARKALRDQAKEDKKRGR
jgi:hypothetical protein